MENVDLPLKIGGKRIGSGADDDEDEDADSNIFSDLVKLRSRSTNASKTSVSSMDPSRSSSDLKPTAASAKTQTALDTTAELDGGPAVAELEGTKPLVELEGDEKNGGLVELDARQTYVELPGDFEKRLDLSGGDARRAQEKARYGV